jgi:flagellar motor switch protein FliM
MLRVIEGASVELDSRLEGAAITVEDFLMLREGDLLEFDHPLERSVQCNVNGKPKFRGQVVSMGNRKALRID